MRISPRDLDLYRSRSEPPIIRIRAKGKKRSKFGVLDSFDVFDFFFLFPPFVREESSHFLVPGPELCTRAANTPVGVRARNIRTHPTRGPSSGSPLRPLCSQILSQFSSARRSAAGRNWLPVLRSAAPICPRAGRPVDDEGPCVRCRQKIAFRRRHHRGHRSLGNAQISH